MSTRVPQRRADDRPRRSSVLLILILCMLGMGLSMNPPDLSAMMAGGTPMIAH